MAKDWTVFKKIEDPEIKVRNQSELAFVHYTFNVRNQSKLAIVHFTFTVRNQLKLAIVLNLLKIFTLKY